MSLAVGHGDGLSSKDFVKATSHGIDRNHAQCRARNDLAALRDNKYALIVDDLLTNLDRSF